MLILRPRSTSTGRIFAWLKTLTGHFVPDTEHENTGLRHEFFAIDRKFVRCRVNVVVVAFCRFTSFSFPCKNSRNGLFFLHISLMQNLIINTFRTADFLRSCLRTQLLLQDNWKKRNLLLASIKWRYKMLIAWS